MTINEIKALDKKVISLGQLEEIKESEHVIVVDYMGSSFVHTYCLWYAVELEDNTDIFLYIKEGE